MLQLAVVRVNFNAAKMPHIPWAEPLQVQTGLCNHPAVDRAVFGCNFRDQLGETCKDAEHLSLYRSRDTRFPTILCHSDYEFIKIMT